MAWDDLKGLKSRGYEIGNHITNHITLSDASELPDPIKIDSAGERLREALKEQRHDFVWPRGRLGHSAPVAAGSVFDTGHISFASTVRGGQDKSPHSALCRLDNQHGQAVASRTLRHSTYLIKKIDENSLVWSRSWSTGAGADNV